VSLGILAIILMIVIVFAFTGLPVYRSGDEVLS
jgi:hypothetical protein